MTYHLVYSSVALTPFTQSELLELLHKVRATNTRLGLTGLLLYKRAEFMQLLEGKEEVVLTLYQRITEDPRHHHIVTLLSSPAIGRLFPDWSMGFQRVGDESPQSVPGYNPAPKLPLSDVYLPWKTSVAMRLLAGFTNKG